MSSTYVGKPIGKNASNVAISRAVEKMIIFKSIKSSEVSVTSGNDSIRVFRDWLAYLELSSNDKKRYIIDSNKNAEKFDSAFEEDVYKAIIKGIKPLKNIYIETKYAVGSYSIDIALMDSDTNKFLLGIEVDGYKYNSEFVEMTKDIERQRFIEAKGYPIYRVLELTWKMNPDAILDEIDKLI